MSLVDAFVYQKLVTILKSIKFELTPSIFTLIIAVVDLAVLLGGLMLVLKNRLEKKA